MPDEIKYENGSGMRLEEVLRAAELALSSGVEDIADAIMKACNNLPADASEFDRGLAGGVAVARYLNSRAGVDHK